ncbi:inositol monophosphatase family protein [Herbiconiux sp. L3-i23]|uniref:inositol monophosphatase family protein n=1 Tax=Herbiconiux sp. L3-i23 TaxID=2905871 RepID=UPI002059C372|nr:inositol monophosphatase family protein [Herbiconiux sp. L3-i23]BDI23327.1 histidinol-phosphatase [Herbiconiux sp. L3-i23]
MTGDFSEDLRFARDLADMAHVISLERYRALDLAVETKPDRSPVTDADRAVEQALRAAIREERPDDAVFGEEFGGELQKGRQWIIDPIDATANFLRGVPIWGTLIALAVDDDPVVGVVSAPALGRRWWAARGEGAWLVENGAAPRRLAVSAVRELADASFSYNDLQYWRGAGKTEQLLALADSVWRTRAYGDFWSYMMVAEGSVDLVAEFGPQIYDLAALAPIIEEAGGRISSTTGERIFTARDALVSNGLLHERAVAAIGD